MSDNTKIARFDNNLVDITVVINRLPYEAARRRDYLAAKFPDRVDEEEEIDEHAYKFNAYEFPAYELNEEQNKLLKSGTILSAYGMAVEQNRKALYDLLDTLRSKPFGSIGGTTRGIPVSEELGPDVLDVRLPQLIRFTWKSQFGHKQSLLWRNPYGLDIEGHRLASDDDIESQRVLRRPEEVDDLGQEIIPAE